MLVPHRRDDAELSQARLAPEKREETLIFVGLEPMLGDELRRDGDIVLEHCR